MYTLIHTRSCQPLSTLYNVDLYENKKTEIMSQTKWAVPFLALLDYVSRAHEIEIRPSSVRRPSVASMISDKTEVIVWISFKL